MKRLLGLAVGVVAAFPLFSSQASAETLTSCLAKQHVCVSGEGRSLISRGQEARLERQIGGDDIYLVVAASGKAGYDSAMNKIITALGGHKQFTVGFLDTQRSHFGAYGKGMLPAHGAADIATRVVKQHQADQNVFAALTDFVTDVKRAAGPSPGHVEVGAVQIGRPSHAWAYVLVIVGLIAALAVVGFLLIVRPIRKRRQRELDEAKSAAQDDLIALSSRITDQDADVSVHNSQEAAAEQGAALTAYERGTAALDAAKRVGDMGAVSRAIAEGQYHLACAEALAAGRSKPDPRPSCFFDPRHGMSVSDVYWAPADGGPARTVPACSSCAHKLERGIEPEMRKVEFNGTPVNYVNAGFAPSYWGGFGFLPGMFTGFLLGETLGSFVGYPAYSFGDAGYGGDYDGGDASSGDYGGGDFDGGDGDFGGGDFGGGDFGGGDFG